MATTAPASAGSEDRVEAVLTALEKRSDGLSDIRCGIVLQETDDVNLTTSRRMGHLLFLMSKPNPRFFVTFDKTVIDDQVGKRQWFLFDGHWLYQANERISQVTKQEMAKPDESQDFFDMDTAPFPIPFGQKKEKILKNFDVVLAAPIAGDPPNTDHLICTPKKASRMHRKYQRLEFFVRKDVHLPSRIIVVKDDGDVVTTADFDLSERSINAGVSTADFAPPKEWKKYEWVVEGLD